MPSTSYPCPGCNQQQNVQHGFGTSVEPALCPACAEECDALGLKQLDYARRRHDLRQRQLEAQS